MTQHSMLAGARFHHVGYACSSIAREADFFTSLGYHTRSAIFSDDAQGVRGLFMTGGGPCIELLENLPARDTLTPWLDAGICMYHLAYEVPVLDTALLRAQEQRGKVIVAPVPAVAFDGRRISFVMFRHGPLIELIENPHLPAATTTTP